jgi:hypothetical protein
MSDANKDIIQAILLINTHNLTKVAFVYDTCTARCQPLGSALHLNLLTFKQFTSHKTKEFDEGK